jgi:hypothetical protein
MPPSSPLKEQALQLLAELSAAQAALEAAVSPYKAEVAKINAAITKATASAKAEIDEIDAKLKALGIEHGAELFGAETGSLTECGLRLLVTPSEGVELLDEEESICVRLQRDLSAAKEPHERLALSSLLSVKLAVNKGYALRNYEHAPDWFEHYGVSVQARKNASVKPAPKPREPKSKKSAPKAPAEEAQPEAA